MARCLIALGSNEGNRAATIQTALETLVAAGSRLVARSANYSTAPIGGPSGQPQYFNAAAILETSNTPQQLLNQLMETEQSLGRIRDQRWGARTIDLDLLLYDEQIVAQPNLIIPHPRLAFRRFVLEPSAEIAASWRHPVIGWTLKQLLDHIDGAANYAAICETASSDAADLYREIVDRADVWALHLDWSWQSDSKLEPFVERFDKAVTLLEQVSLPSAKDRWLISDFWIYDALAIGRAVRSQTALFEMGLIVDHDLVGLRPKLLIVIEELSAKSRYDSALEEVLREHYQGPMLRLTANNPESVNEIIAAMQGMTGK